MSAPGSMGGPALAIGWNDIFDDPDETVAGAAYAGGGGTLSLAPPLRGSGVLGVRQEHLRAGAGCSKRQLAVDRTLKERFTECRVDQLRRPGDVQEMELKALTGEIEEMHRMRRREARENWRLRRRCRVKPHEDIEELKKKYVGSEHLQPLPELGSSAEARAAARLCARDFFTDLARRRPADVGARRAPSKPGR